MRHGERHMSIVRHPNLADLQSIGAFSTATRLLNIQDNGLNQFFHGTIERTKAVELLSGKPTGTFLIRYTTKLNTYCVSFRDPNFGGEIKHNLLYLLNLADGSTGYSVLPAQHFVPGVNDLYPSLGDFVKAYQRKGRLREAVHC